MLSPGCCTRRRSRPRVPPACASLDVLSTVGAAGAAACGALAPSMTAARFFAVVSATERQTSVATHGVYHYTHLFHLFLHDKHTDIVPRPPANGDSRPLVLCTPLLVDLAECRVHAAACMAAQRRRAGFLPRKKKRYKHHAACGELRVTVNQPIR